MIYISKTAHTSGDWATFDVGDNLGGHPMQATERYRCRRDLERSIRAAGHGARILGYEQAQRRYPADYETAVRNILAHDGRLVDAVFFSIYGGLAVAFVETPNSLAYVSESRAGQDRIVPLMSLDKHVGSKG